MITEEMKTMSIKDRIILMEEIWATLRHDETEIESPAWHKDILDERQKQIKEGKAEFISVNDLKTNKK